MWASYALAERLPGVGGVPIVTGLALLVTSVIPERIRKVWGGAPQVISGLCMQLFFATIGATTDLKNLFSSGALLPLFAFISIILSVCPAFGHYVMIWSTLSVSSRWSLFKRCDWSYSIRFTQPVSSLWGDGFFISRHRTFSSLPTLLLAGQQRLLQWCLP